MRIFDTLYAEPDELRLGHPITPTAANGSMDRTEFVTTEFHEDSFLGAG
jgi:hypothetical protein